MPGLLRGIARTAAVAGTATAVSNRVSRRQGNRWAAKEQQQPQGAAQPPPQQYAPAAAMPVSSVDRLSALTQLGELKTQGVLSESEFATEKARILST
ncbi:MAG: SHOCT domain-containing protein [Rhodococcus sp. (in: high G+C Gram-positive bacteria)]